MPDSNAPQIDLTAALDPASLQWWIEYSYSEHAAAIAALMERFIKFCDVTQNGIHDDYVCGAAADFSHDLKQAANALDETRTRIKRPILHAQRLVDGEAKKLTDRVTAATTEVQARVTTYLRMKEKEAREAAEREAQRLQAEAERMAQAALADPTLSAEAAVDAFDAADKATELAHAKATELTRTRGTQGALTALRDNWTFEIVSLSAVPLHFLQVNDAAVRLAIKQGQREIPGLRIWNDAKAYVR
jgi:F0F1-type ATP synthase membrane subunit b/b'